MKGVVGLVLAKKQLIDGNKLDIFCREMLALVNDAC